MTNKYLEWKNTILYCKGDKVLFKGDILILDKLASINDEPGLNSIWKLAPKYILYVHALSELNEKTRYQLQKNSVEIKVNKAIKTGSAIIADLNNITVDADQFKTFLNMLEGD